jgi:uncharacterized protein YndB with AHSA1/START domain
MSAEATNATARPFEIAREFDAPRDLVWKAWTEAERLERWWGPKGCPVKVHRLEVQPGGLFLYSMALPNGDLWWGRFQYREVEAPFRLTYASAFANEAGEVVRAPFSENWPLEVLNELTLTEENGRTIVRLTGGPVDATEDERAFFESFFASMEQGFGGTFDQLAEHLRSTRS